MANLEGAFLSAEIRYKLWRWLEASGSVACCCHWLVPVSSMSCHYWCRCVVTTTGIVISSLLVHCCCAIVYCCHVLRCLGTISITVLSMCRCYFVARCCQYFVPVLLFLGQYFVALASLTVTLSYLCLVAVSFWYYFHLISVFIVGCKIDYQYWNHVENNLDQLYTNLAYVSPT